MSSDRLRHNEGRHLMIPETEEWKDREKDFHYYSISLDRHELWTMKQTHNHGL